MHELDDKDLFQKVVSSLEEQLGVSDIQKVAIGNEFYVLRADIPNGQEPDDTPSVIIIKVPKDKIFSNVNDAYIDSRELLNQEFALMQHVRAEGIQQVPKPIRHIEAAGFGALIMSYEPSDDSKPDEYRLGQLLATIHNTKLPDIQLSAQEGSEIPELIADRLSRRWSELNALVAELPELPGRESIIELLESTRQHKQLLHMDFRQANFRMKHGEVAALLDWSNALIGHPLLELARVAETGEVGKPDKIAEEFLRGYASVADLPSVDPIIETIFRLDAATMLALVFLSEDPDPERAPVAVSRVRELHKRMLH